MFILYVGSEQRREGDHGGSTSLQTGQKTRKRIHENQLYVYKRQQQYNNKTGLQSDSNTGNLVLCEVFFRNPGRIGQNF